MNGDSLTELKKLEKESIQTVVTSPPYWGLRDYGDENQLGLEPTPEQYAENLVKVFRKVREKLKDDGTVWLNIGDSYYGSSGGGGGASSSSTFGAGSGNTPAITQYTAAGETTTVQGYAGGAGMGGSPGGQYGTGGGGGASQGGKGGHGVVIARMVTANFSGKVYGADHGGITTDCDDTVIIFHNDGYYIT